MNSIQNTTLVNAARQAWRRLRKPLRIQKAQPIFSQIAKIEALVRASKQYPKTNEAPVLLMAVTARMTQFSFNSGVDLFLSWTLRANGIPVQHFFCDNSLPLCQLGTSWKRPDHRPDCALCQSLSHRYFPEDIRVSPTAWPDYDQELLSLEKKLAATSVEQLRDFTYEGLPFGKLTHNSLIWALRMGNPENDPNASRVYAKYIIGAINIARQLTIQIEKNRPRAIVLFNGVSFPEAVASAIAKKNNIPLTTYETGHKEGSIHFSHIEATRYDIEVPADFTMKAAEDAQLDEHLKARFQGNFKMGGIDFWKEIKPIPDELKNKIKNFKKVAPVFTNVIFDTSQAYSNLAYSDMFEWLDELVKIAREEQDTLFIIRAHPDETRPGKASRQTVQDWYKNSKVASALKNIYFIPPEVPVNSYQLIEAADFTIVYNSTIGLESVLHKKPCIAAGFPRYQSSGAVDYAKTHDDFKNFIHAAIHSDYIGPENAYQLARRYYYYTYFNAYVDLSAYLGANKDVASFNIQSIEQLRPENSSTIKLLLNGINNNQSFYQGVTL